MWAMHGLKLSDIILGSNVCKSGQCDQNFMNIWESTRCMMLKFQNKLTKNIAKFTNSTKSKTIYFFLGPRTYCYVNHNFNFLDPVVGPCVLFTLRILTKILIIFCSWCLKVKRTLYLGNIPRVTFPFTTGWHEKITIPWYLLHIYQFACLVNRSSILFKSSWKLKWYFDLSLHLTSSCRPRSIKNILCEFIEFELFT